MHAWEQIQETVNYIEEHISDEITMEVLARIAALSPFYYQRLFCRLVKKPVSEYIKLRRLARASETLLDKNKRIIDAAMDFGFSSHETFTRTFKEAFGITPEEYRKNPVRLNHFGKPQLMLNYTLVDENVPLITDEIMLEITRKQILLPQHFIGLTAQASVTQIPLGVQTGVDVLGTLWDTFHEQKANIPNLTANGDELGVASIGRQEGYFTYFAGAQADSNASLDGYESWDLPAGAYIVCSFEAENFERLVMDVLYKAQRYLFETWLPSHKLVTQAFSVERYASHEPATTKMEVWVLPVPIEAKSGHTSN